MKELKDYINLYLGCEALLLNGTRIIIEGVYYSETRTYVNYLIQDSNSDMNGVDGSCLANNIKPIFRPLSDMTEEECITANSLSLDGALDGDSNIKHYYPRQAVFFEPKEFVFLLSIGIDLFGLIESGLAIDKSTLTQSNK